LPFILDWPLGKKISESSNLTSFLSDIDRISDVISSVEV